MKKQNKEKKEVFVDEHEVTNDVLSDVKDIDDIEIVSDNGGLENTKLKKIQKELVRCRKEKQEYLNGWQRTKADYINALRRFEKDVSVAKDSGVRKSVMVLLPVLESLQRAQNTGGKLPAGFDAIVKQIFSAFTTLSVTKIQVKIGDVFNPMLHEALGRNVVKDKKKDNTVFIVLEAGWKLHDEVIQPAKVSVAYYN